MVMDLYGSPALSKYTGYRQERQPAMLSSYENHKKKILSTENISVNPVKEADLVQSEPWDVHT